MNRLFIMIVCALIASYLTFNYGILGFFFSVIFLCTSVEFSEHLSKEKSLAEQAEKLAKRKTDG